MALLCINLCRTALLKVVKVCDNGKEPTQYQLLRVKNMLYCISTSLQSNQFTYTLYTVHNNNIIMCVDWNQDKRFNRQMTSKIFTKDTTYHQICVDNVNEVIGLWCLKVDKDTDETTLIHNKLQIIL